MKAMPGMAATLLLAAVLLAGAVIPTRAVAQIPGMPADVQAIMQKLQRGQAPTEAEAKRLEQWGQSLQGGASGGAGESPLGSTGTPTPPQGLGSPTAAAKPPCPRPAKTPIAPAALTSRQYVALVNSLVETYGRRLGGDRQPIDAGLRRPRASGATLGAVLLTQGAGTPAIYASALAAQRDPANLQAANNLAVALDSVPESKASIGILLYVRQLQPRAALPAVNLAWAYYNAGNAPLAQKQFEEASRLAPELAGPDAGLGLLATCRGDTITAMRHYKASLGKGYSGVIGMAYRQAKAAQQQSGNQTGEESAPPSGSRDSSPLPELPVSPEPARTAGALSSFQRAANVGDQRLQQLLQRNQALTARVAALGRRAHQDPDGALVLPRVFDRELFQYGEIVDLTLGARLRPLGPQMQQMGGVVERVGAQVGGQLSVDAPQVLKLQERLIKLMEALGECLRGCGSSDPCAKACEAKFRSQANAVQRQIEEINYRDCQLVKGQLDTTYSQNYKVWKAWSDAVREGSRDLYAYSQPVIDRIWVPALNELLQVNREMAVLTYYTYVARSAESLAGMAQGYKDLICVPPAPEQPAGGAADPTLPTKKPDCPLEPPLRLRVSGAELELGCSTIRLELGEGLKVKFARDFVRKETAIWAGAGVDVVSASVGEAGMTPGSPKFELSGEAGFGIRFSDSGAVLDVNSTTGATATISVAGATASGSVSSGFSLENGVNFDPGFQATAPSLPTP